MRIIAGTFRGRRLLGPDSDTTRPITDRVKQSVFDVLAGHLPNAVVYDCFAGTGSLGLESASRGARQVVCFERDRAALKHLRTNIQTLRCGDRVQVVAGDVFAWFDAHPTGEVRADVVFLDPPYRFLAEQPDSLRRLAAIAAAGHLAADGVVVLRYPSGQAIALPMLTVYDERVYGGMAVQWLRRAD